ncbi:hypothetical protein AZE42_07238 [Rhizopogon vesiculosus]|uniref:Uncharacterized protein n=1 Tax=Rhizopogon vesiculosus TaxID=180088 RepID=A0A1J8PRZ4_9AGAM|nr:hypothetical protein AZE42_07238 [Rhizopogon vesiculosus]
MLGDAKPSISYSTAGTGRSWISYIFRPLDNGHFIAEALTPQGSGSLGVYDVQNNMPVYRVDISQTWVLEKADIGIAICKVVDGKAYAWYLDKKDEPVHAPREIIKFPCLIQHRS